MWTIGTSLRRPSAAPPGELVARYLAWCGAAGYAPETVRARRGYLRHFLEWAAERGIRRLASVRSLQLADYQVSVHALRKRDGRPIGTGAVTQRLVAVRGLLRWAASHGACTTHVVQAIVIPPARRTLPRHVLGVNDIERLMALPVTTTTLGCRDRAMLETLYSTGIRRAELAALDSADIKWDRGTALIRQGKGRRDRLVPVGRRALRWIARYLRDARPTLARGRTERRCS